MAACRRVLHGFRHAQQLVRATVGFVTGVPAQRARHGFEFAAEASASASRVWQGEWEGISRARAHAAGWSAWGHLTERGVHATGWRQDEDDEKREAGGRSGGGNSGVGVSKQSAGVEEGKAEREGVCANVANEEARELLQQVHLTSLRKKLREDARDTISYGELLHLCRTVGMASSDEEATRMAHVFNQAGVVLTFREKVHLHPEKIAELVANVLPLSLLGEDDQRRLELMALEKRKDEIDKKAHKQMRFVLWTGLVGLTMQVMLFFRLTFWELSWDVMEPIAFFTTATGLICGYTYFMFTSRDPSYQDFMQRIYQSRQRKLFKKQNFDIKRFKELQLQCQTPLQRNKMLEDAD